MLPQLRATARAAFTAFSASCGDLICVQLTKFEFVAADAPAGDMPAVLGAPEAGLALAALPAFGDGLALDATPPSPPPPQATRNRLSAVHAQESK